jgi:hypothetical protein
MTESFDNAVQSLQQFQMGGDRPAETVPDDIAANLFNSVGAVEISEYREPNSPILTARQCPS